MIYSQPTFLCTLRSESLGHQEAPDEVWPPTVLVPACTRRTGRTPQFVAADLAWASSKLICTCFRRARASSSCFLSLRNCLRSFLMSRLSSSSCYSSWAANSASFLFWHCLDSFCSMCEIFSFSVEAKSWNSRETSFHSFLLVEFSHWSWELCALSSMGDSCQRSDCIAQIWKVDGGEKNRI